MLDHSLQSSFFPAAWPTQMATTSKAARTLPRSEESNPNLHASSASAMARPLTNEHVEGQYEKVGVPTVGCLRIQNHRKRRPFRSTKRSKLEGKLRCPSRKMDFTPAAETNW